MWDRFDIERESGLYDIYATLGESADPVAVKTAWQIHGRCYVDYEYFLPTALMDDDTLDPTLDGTREKPGMPFRPTYLLATPRGEPVEASHGGARILDRYNEDHWSFPTYSYYLKAGDVTTLAALTDIENRYPNSLIREIAALSHRGSPIASYEIMRALIQNATIHKTQDGTEEIFVTALTNKSLGPVIDIVSPGAYELLGKPTEIYQDDDRAVRGLSVTPVLIRPSEIMEATVERARSASSRTKPALDRRVEFFADGLTRQQLPAAVVDYLDSQARLRAS